MIMEDFSSRVLDICLRIPKGKVSTYAMLACAAGSSQAARAVGNALNKNEKPVVVPCHRVVRSDGFVGGYAFGAKKKIALLRGEGVKVSSEGRVDLKRYLFKIK